MIATEAGFCPFSGKAQYETAGEARRQLACARRSPRFHGAQRHLGRDQAGIYQCRFCGHWHVGRRRNRRRASNV